MAVKDFLSIYLLRLHPTASQGTCHVAPPLSWRSEHCCSPPPRWLRLVRFVLLRALSSVLDPSSNTTLKPSHAPMFRLPARRSVDATFAQLLSWVACWAISSFLHFHSSRSVVELFVAASFVGIATRLFVQCRVCRSSIDIGYLLRSLLRCPARLVNHSVVCGHIAPTSCAPNREEQFSNHFWRALAPVRPWWFVAPS